MSLVLWHLLEIKGADIPGVQVGSAQWSPDSTRSLDTLAALPADKALPVRCWHVSWVCWPVDQTFRKTNWFKWCYWHDVMWYHVISYHHSCFHEVPPANTVQKRQTERKAIWPVPKTCFQPAVVTGACFSLMFVSDCQFGRFWNATNTSGPMRSLTPSMK